MKIEYLYAALAAVALVAFGAYFFDLQQADEPEFEFSVEGVDLPDVSIDSNGVEVGS